ncbi:MAG: rRNA maturation RNase YbeY [Endomicrobiaceae bacterium]|jgi:probable rRNA maturation factor|nr:rRNA maturation RNase YbeY [Endomicrobiaceae bacterium]MDD3922809.1 rRNA maturation RNase YbeY [Endomicrobiaceae bacterium]
MQELNTKHQKKNNLSKQEVIFKGFNKKILPLLQKAADITLKHEKIKQCQISFTMISDQDIKKMNRKYRKVNRITDVISFLVSKELFMGDIYISTNRPKQNAKKYGFTHEQELCYLIIHGILHLEGYTDYDVENKSLMFSKQDKIFKCLFS